MYIRLLNLLVQFQISIWQIFITGLDLLQLFVGPFPYWFCLAKNFIKLPIPITLGLILGFSSFLKFYVLCVTKTMPEMNESLIGKRVVFYSLGISLIGVIMKFASSGKPSFNVVRTFLFLWRKKTKKKFSNTRIIH